MYSWGFISKSGKGTHSVVCGIPARRDELLVKIMTAHGRRWLNYKGLKRWERRAYIRARLVLGLRLRQTEYEDLRFAALKRTMCADSIRLHIAGGFDGDAGLLASPLMFESAIKTGI